MLKLSTFYNDDASESWFTQATRRRGSVHEKLLASGFTLMSKEALKADYSALHVPVECEDLSFAKSIPAPKSEFKTAFMFGYAAEFKNKLTLNGVSAEVVFNQWMTLAEGQKKFIVSLTPKSYLVAHKDVITFSDVFDISREWAIDCFLGVFDESNKSMLVFNEEFQVTYASFDPSMEVAHFDEVARAFSNRADEDRLRELKGRTGGDSSRLEEFYSAVIKPNV